MFISRIALVIYLISIFFNSCSTKELKISRAFYYWKSEYSRLSDNEWNCLDTLKIQKLYVKFFEVEKDPIFGNKPFAKSELRLNQFYYSKEDTAIREKLKTVMQLEIIPVVYIKNEIFLSSSVQEIDLLADNINFLINKYYQERFAFDTLDYKNMLNSTGSKSERYRSYSIYDDEKLYTNTNFNEIQLDCDWTEKSKTKYFYFLTKLKQKSLKKISCTLRLYPFKYAVKMGVPPVECATLMCYNLSNFSENKNAVQDNEELELYLKNSKQYPLPLDVALPAFSYAKLYQNNKFIRFINLENIDLVSCTKPIKPMWYEFIKDLETSSMYLRVGDKIKVEDVNEIELYKTISLLKKHIKFTDSTTITFFNLSDEGIKKYSYETYSNSFNSFSK